MLDHLCTPWSWQSLCICNPVSQSSIQIFQRGLFIPRTNAIHVDTLGCPFITHSLCHLQNTSFGACIRSDIDVPDERNDGGNVDDLARPLQLEQSLADLLRRYE